MGRKPRKKRKLKPSIPYFIVEGCTEENYLKVLKSVYRKKIKIENANGGSARAVLQEAEKIVSKNPEYTQYIIWFDNDTFSEQDKNLVAKLNKNRKITIAQSYPCVEAWLVAHFIKINGNQLNMECKKFEKDLGVHIKNYKKNNCSQLAKYIQVKHIELAKINYPKYTQNIEYILGGMTP